MSVVGISPYEALGNAVVLQAVKDYRDAVNKLRRGKKNISSVFTKMVCEKFFHSQYFI